MNLTYGLVLIEQFELSKLQNKCRLWDVQHVSGESFMD